MGDVQLQRREIPLSGGALSIAVLALSISLSACVTTQGGAGTSAFPQLNPTALTDFFSGEVREFKTLMNDGKTDQALSYFKDKASYFDERYAKSDGNVPPEFTRLAEHVLTQEWQPSLLTGRLAVMNLFALGDTQARADARAAWKNATERQEVVEGSALFKITRVGRDEVAKLAQAREKLKERALAQKAEVLPKLMDEVLAGTFASIPYVADLNLESAEFQASPGFQAVAMERLNAASSPAEVERLARRLHTFLSPENQSRADHRFAAVLRQGFMADGRISLDELGQLAQMKTPLGVAPDAIKGIVKVGLASTVRRSGSRGFSVTTQKDLAFDLENAAEALLKTRDASTYDFVYLVSVADAVAQRQVGSERPQFSRYRTGTDRERNPDHARARERVAEAQRNFNQARANAEGYRCAQGVSASYCRNVAIILGAAVVTSSNSLEEARRALASTPETLEKPRMASYQYRLTPHTVAKEVRGVTVLWDVKGKQAWLMPLAHKAQRSFEVVDGVHADDPERASLLNRADKERDVDQFAKEGIELPLSTLFPASRLGSAQKLAARDANAVLAMLDEEYARTAPKDDPPGVGKVFRLPQ